MNNKTTYNIIDKDNINESISRVINSNIDFNIYSTPQGMIELRDAICKLLTNEWEFTLNPNNMIITTGAQQALNLIAYSFLSEGDTILIEEPTYYGALDVFRSRNLNIVGVSLQNDGIDLNDLEEKIQKHSPKLIYVIPTFNNPTGIAWTNEKRIEFLKIINKYNVLVIEDDPYYMLNFTNYIYKSLYSLNNGKNVFYLGTFSKMVSPSINVGYIITDENKIDKLTSFKKNFDLNTSTFMQYVILDYLQNYDLKYLMKNRTNIYKELLEECINKLNTKYKGEIISLSKPMGGFFFLVKFKNSIYSNIFENGNNFYLDKNHDNEARINITNYLNIENE